MAWRVFLSNRLNRKWLYAKCKWCKVLWNCVCMICCEDFDNRSCFKKSWNTLCSRSSFDQPYCSQLLETIQDIQTIHLATKKIGLAAELDYSFAFCLPVDTIVLFNTTLFLVAVSQSENTLSFFSSCLHMVQHCQTTSCLKIKFFLYQKSFFVAHCN